jgi:hypothetical protein
MAPNMNLERERVSRRALVALDQTRVLLIPLSSERAWGDFRDELPTPRHAFPLLPCISNLGAPFRNSYALGTHSFQRVLYFDETKLSFRSQCTPYRQQTQEWNILVQP